MTEDATLNGNRELLRWFRILRWVAVFGQISAMIYATKELHLVLPWAPLLIGLLLTCFANHFLPEITRAGSMPLGISLLADILLLTLILYWTGGTHNPFVIFYLLFIALGAMTLGSRGLLAILSLCAAAYTWMLYQHTPFEGPPRIVQNGQLVYSVHRQGSIIAFVTLGISLAVFIQRMQRTLVSHRQDLHEALKRATENERFQSLATLAAGVAHELGTPLGTIAVASKELERTLERQGSTPDTQEDARLIRSEVDRCRTILRRLDRQTTNGTGSPPESCTTGSFAPALATRMSGEFGKRLAVHDHAENTTLNLSLEPLLQSLVVLIENACEADPSGKPVVLEIRIRAGNLIFRVLDSGRGTTEEIRRRAVEPYFTTKPGDGTGLGLFLVRTLAMQLGGDVALHPRADGGTCATLTLPLQKPL